MFISENDRSRIELFVYHLNAKAKVKVDYVLLNITAAV